MTPTRTVTVLDLDLLRFLVLGIIVSNSLRASNRGTAFLHVQCCQGIYRLIIRFPSVPAAWHLDGAFDLACKPIHSPLASYSPSASRGQNIDLNHYRKDLTGRS